MLARVKSATSDHCSGVEGSLVRGRSVGGRGLYAAGGLGCTGDDGEDGAGTG